MKKFLQSLAQSRMLKLAAVAVGSWRFWSVSAFAATFVAGVALVAYFTYFGDGTQGSYPYYRLVSNVGATTSSNSNAVDRVLLMNADRDEKCFVDQDNITGSTTAAKTNRNWWEFLNDDAVTLTGYNLVKGNCFRLHEVGNDGRVLWEFYNCRSGNLNPTTSGGKVNTYQNILPYNTSTAYSFKSRTIKCSGQHLAGTLVFQNTPNARVVSSCLDQGIGTIYFDCVNGFTGYKKSRVAVEVAYGVWAVKEDGTIKEPRELAVEVDAEGNERLVPPDDAHCHEIIKVRETPEGGLEEALTNFYARCAWKTVNLTGATFCNDKTGSIAVTNELTLAMPLEGAAGSTKNFYRVWAPVQDEKLNADVSGYCRGPMRFQIRRADDPQKESGHPLINLDGSNISTSPQDNGLIILDNIIASFPAMSMTAVPGGTYVEGGSSRNVIGWTGVLRPADAPDEKYYPKAGEGGLVARAGVSVFTNAPPDATVTDAWQGEVTAAMKWRWRYLTNTNAWESAPLTVRDGAFVSETPITLPGMLGDIEFYFETALDAPYYGYVDYSGTGKGTPGYCERISRIESRLNPKAIGPLGLPSCGTDFFFRPREGHSEQLELDLEIRRGGNFSTNFPFQLTGDRLWKCYVKTTTNETSVTSLPVGDYEFRIVGLDPAVRYGGEPVEFLPWSGKILRSVESPAGGWTAFHVDGLTGNLMFQVSESADGPEQLALTLVHADYQDFTFWTDACTTNKLYVGAYSENRGRQSGAAPDTREFPSELPSWSATAASSNTSFWTEGFTITSPRTPEQGWGEYPAYTPFARCNTPKGWLAQNAQWVCSQWRQSAQGGEMALQLAGSQSGSLAYTNAKEVPHGLDRVTLRARVAQSAAFEDFAYYSGGGDLEDLHDYAFSVRAVMSTTAASTDFDGAGSVSVVGCYQPGAGCYEIRAVRTADDTVTIYLYKWTYDEDSDTVLPKMVARHASTRKFKTESYLRCSNAGGSPYEQASGYYGHLFIRCTRSDGKMVVEGGIMNASKKLAEMEQGASFSHYYLKYTDSDNPLTFGTFGFGSLNCPAQFIYPLWYADASKVTVPDVKTKSYDENGKQISNPACGNGTLSFTIDTATKVFQSGATTRYKNWVYKSGKFSGVETVSDYNALSAKAPTGKLELYVTAGGTETLKDTQPLSGYKFQAVTNTVRNQADSLIRLSPAKGSGDIVVDDISFTQWCAASYDDSDNTDFDDKIPTLGCPANYVYLNGWVVSNKTEHLLKLQPRRARSNVLMELRAPLMDGLDGRGFGLGVFSFTYRNAHSNCILRVQYCTDINGAGELRARTAALDGWTDAKVIDFSKIDPAELAGGTISAYVGLHGVQGAMRLLVDPSVVAQAQAEDDLDYGSIEIVDFLTRDAPNLDDRCWWGWNLRTTDDIRERSLYDSRPSDVGLALALNDSTTNDVEQETKDLYSQKLPFVQTPRFGTNLVGEVTFRARRLPDCPPGQFTEIAVLGIKDGFDPNVEGNWTWLKTIVISNDCYGLQSYKTKSGDDYLAFRLAVIGVEGVTPNHADKMEPEVPVAQRVLIDEVAVSEAVRAGVALRGVGAFRTNLDDESVVANVTAKEQQPLCRESWGVQCEVYVSQLEDEIDYTKGFDVTLHWFDGTEPWGYDNWKTNALAKEARLSRAEGTSSWIFRSSYVGSPQAVVGPSMTTTTVQYMLEVRYYAKGESEPQTKLLQSADWFDGKMPAWYSPIDLNAGRNFSAYTILDTVSPGWAWINEVNVFGTYDRLWKNSDDNRQYVEIAMPREADLTGWKLLFLDGNVQSGAVVTNRVATFGKGDVAATKSQPVDSNCVFLVVACPGAKTAGTLDPEKGEVDGYWRFDHTGTSAFSTGETIVPNNAFAIQLVRPSGIVEHELIVLGTNWWAGTSMDDFDADKLVDFYNRNEGGRGRFFFAGFEHGGDPNSLGALRTGGSTSNEWSCAMARTPGRINQGEAIDPDHPIPLGSSILVYLNIGAFGHLKQVVDGETNALNRLVIVKKGDARGLDVEYIADRWYELGSVTTNGEKTAFTPLSAPRTYRVTVAKNCSNELLTVEANAVVNARLREDHGLTDENPFTPAVMSWLETGTDIDGNRWEDDGETEEIQPAEFWSYNGTYSGPMGLKEMYWLDIPPTEGGWILRGGISELVPGHFPYYTQESDHTKTNVRMTVFMMISNRNETASWATECPHRLAHPPVVIQNCEGSPTVTFKMIGFMNVPEMMSGMKDPANWVPLRWFTFNKDSFYPRGHAKAFQSTVDIRYPYTKESPAISYGVGEWLRTHPGDIRDFFYFWTLDERLLPLQVDLMKPESLY